MKKLIRSRSGASKRAALIVVLALGLAVTIYNAERARAATDSCVFIGGAVIVTAGNLYKVGDILDPLSGNLCNAADNYGFRLQVASVDSNGHVTAVTVVPGIGYSAPPSNPIRFGGSPTGTGFTANCTFN